MKTKAVTVVILTITFSLSYLMVFQKGRIKTGIKILLSQVRNSEWIYGDAFGYKYRLACPVNFNTANNDRKYPLVIFLHGANERGNDNRIQIYDIPHLGTGGKNKQHAYQTKYPSFVYIPQCPVNETWNDKKTLSGLTKTIATLLNKYPIDRDRLYLIGYSMGGSGSYALAEQYYQTNKQSFAGIIRLAGQSLFNQQTHKIISNSSVWLHVGLKDAAIRVKAAGMAYQELKELAPGAIESTSSILVTNHPGITRTLTLNGVEIAKFSEYTDDGHTISDFPFQDALLMDWLFTQRRREQDEPIMPIPNRSIVAGSGTGTGA